MSVTKSLSHDQPTEHRDRLFIGEIRRDWEPKRVESFLRAILPDATTIDAYAEGSPLVRNRGFAFVSFADVGAAVRAKEKLLNSPIKCNTWFRGTSSSASRSAFIHISSS
ncbi:unnamed protein product [Haemonchus placei]|uniref:RRM domain-containing protein n=1 Tax=Haemonchus placei TaxID=6290 RepID=A0A0N4WIM0_HAEPC|nr:unnamed protein product [Haemonchus placei]